jgi:hypothetical protein
VLVALFYWVRRHYLRVAQVLEPQSGQELEELGLTAGAVPNSTVVVFVAQVNAMTARALAIARALSPDDLNVVTISSNPERLLRLQATWVQLDLGIPLQVVDSPYREFVGPAVAYVRSLKPSPQHWVSVVIPEFVVEHWWEELLHNQDALRLKAALLRVPWVGVMSVPLHMGAAPTGSTKKRKKAERPAEGNGTGDGEQAGGDPDAEKNEPPTTHRGKIGW